MTSPPPGITLAEALERGAFHPRQAVRAGRDIAAILAEQHARGLAHGHVGPEDVLLGDDGVVHLSMSEEIGQPEQDVHDLGAMLLEAIATPPPARTSQPVPPDLPQLLEAMTAPDPVERPTAAQVRDALSTMRLAALAPSVSAGARTITPGAPSTSPPPSTRGAGPTSHRAPSSASDDRRRPVLLALLALALVAVIVGLLVFVLGNGDDKGAKAGPTTTSTTPSTSATTGPTADLIRRINPPPAPARQLSDAANGLGALNATQLVKLGGGSAADQAAIVTALNGLGFQAAHARAWSRGADSTYSVVVYRFQTAAGAKELLTRLSRERPGTAFASKTVPDAVSYSRRNGAQFEQAGSFVHGIYFFDITLATATEDTTHASFDALLAAQRDKADSVS